MSSHWHPEEPPPQIAPHSEAKYALVPQHGSSTYTLSAASPSGMPRSSFNARSTRATM